MEKWEVYPLQQKKAAVFYEMKENGEEFFSARAMDSINRGVVFCDEQAKILYCNKQYQTFVGISGEKLIGKNIRSVRPGALVPEVLRTGKTIEGKLRIENGQEYFTDIYPIIEEDKTVGTVSMVTALADARYIKERMLELEKREMVLKKRLQNSNGANYTFSQLIYTSSLMEEQIKQAKNVARHEVPILLTGESGCGKEVFAQSIHNASHRETGPFVAVNCAAIQKNMLESELFGYESGAFTGARKEGKIGLFELAQDGTIFLDEISEMDLELQTKLLRVIQEGKIRRIGGLKEIPVNARIISACNVDLQACVEEKKFRLDLYYRLAVFPLAIPPLRMRQEDILPIALSHLRGISAENKTNYILDAQVEKALISYEWPGNIRELKNVLEYMVILSEDGLLTMDCLPPKISGRGRRCAVKLGKIEQEEKAVAREIRSLSETLKECEWQAIDNALQRFGYNTAGKKEAAKALGISLASLYSKLNGSPCRRL